MPPPQDEAGVEWKAVKDFPNHMVSSDGRVWLVSKGREAGAAKDNGGYKRVSMYGGTGEHYKRTSTVHRLVAEHFVPNKCSHVYTDIDHIDGDQTNNRADNLRWTTPHINMYNLVTHRDLDWNGSVYYQPKQGKKPWKVQYRLPGDLPSAPLRFECFADEDEAGGIVIERHYDYLFWLEEQAAREAATCQICHPDSALSHPAAWPRK